MSNVTRIRHALPVSKEIADRLSEFETGITDAIAAAKDAGLPQGLLVAILHTYAQQQTLELLN